LQRIFAARPPWNPPCSFFPLGRNSMPAMQLRCGEFGSAVELLIHILSGVGFVSYINPTSPDCKRFGASLARPMSCRTIGWSNLVAAKSGVRY
jgi:hypothetical protein